MTRWHCHIGGKTYGPVEAQQVRQWVQEQRMQPTDMVWCDGMPDWQPANTVAELLTPATPPEGPWEPIRHIRPHRGTLILVLGIAGLTCCAPLGICAWVMGSIDLKAMAAGQMDPTGRDNTNAGRICGVIATILVLASVGFAIIQKFLP